MTYRRPFTMQGDVHPSPTFLLHSRFGGHPFRQPDFSDVIPSRLGPRYWGQSSACAARVNARTAMGNADLIASLLLLLSEELDLEDFGMAVGFKMFPSVLAVNSQNALVKAVPSCVQIPLML